MIIKISKHIFFLANIGLYFITCYEYIFRPNNGALLMFFLGLSQLILMLFFTLGSNTNNLSKCFTFYWKLVGLYTVLFLITLVCGDYMIKILGKGISLIIIIPAMLIGLYHIWCHFQTLNNLPKNK